MKIGGKDFNIGEKTFVMGILNVTPDSFSDGGKYKNRELALMQAQKMMDEGADILDIGGESTRPGYRQISDQEEIERVVPVIRALKERLDIPISIDTYKSTVAQEAIWAGADLVNDIWGLKKDPKMAGVIKDNDISVCIMHNRSQMDYTNFLEDVIHDLEDSLVIAGSVGIADEKIILDPGVGFAKTLEMNLSVIANLDRFVKMGLPVLIGTSRKSVIGLTLELPVTQREEGTMATSVIAVMKGCQFVRVHDVEKNVRAIRMTEQIMRYE